MLGKLLKYEIKSTARLFIPLYAVLLVFALLNKFLNPLQTMETSNSFSLQAMLQGLSLTAYFILVVATFVMTLIITIQRFYKNLLGDEGYLMFTLPVKTWQHITSKLLTAIMWYILSAVAVLTSIMILVGPREFFEFLPEMLQGIRGFLGNAAIVIFPVFVLVQLIYGTLMIYDAIALGHLFQKHKLLASFVMYCVLYGIAQVVLVITIFSLGNTIFAAMIHSVEPTGQQIISFIGMIGVVGGLMAAIHFFVINYLLNNKLNLE